MPRYIVRFGAKSCVRLNVKSYFDGHNRHTIRIIHGGTTVVAFDRFVQVDASHIPLGLIIQASIDAPDIDSGIASAGAFATGLLNILSSVAAAAIDRPFVQWAYDATEGVSERQLLSFTYDHTNLRSTRRASDAELAEFVRAYDAFHSDNSIRQDYKDRVSRAFDAYRRALADNADPLTDFLVVWSSIEGLDCVYRKTFPSKQSDFKDGMRDVFTRLGNAAVFDTLEQLRNEIAHGNLDLAAANATATANLGLTRQALLFMALRIIKCNDAVRDTIAAQVAYKGTFRTMVVLHAKVKCQPGKVDVLEGHPEFVAELNGVQAVPQGDTISLTPDWRVRQNNIESGELTRIDIRGDAGANVKVNDLGVSAIPGAHDAGPSN